MERSLKKIAGLGGGAIVESATNIAKLTACTVGCESALLNGAFSTERRVDLLCLATAAFQRADWIRRYECSSMVPNQAHFTAVQHRWTGHPSFRTEW